MEPYVNPAMTPEDVEIVRRVHGYRLGPVIVHTDNERDAAVMAARFANTFSTAERIIAFVREARGELAARRVAVSPSALEYWDAKISDWATD